MLETSTADAARPGEHLVAAVPVAGERGEGGRVERDQAEALRLVLADGQHAFPGVDVAVVERDRLADPQPGHRQERDEDGIGLGAQWAAQPPAAACSAAMSAGE